jgi:hypothetical protein
VVETCSSSARSRSTIAASWTTVAYRSIDSYWSYLTVSLYPNHLVLNLRHWYGSSLHHHTGCLLKNLLNHRHDIDGDRLDLP